MSQAKAVLMENLVILDVSTFLNLKKSSTHSAQPKRNKSSINLSNNS
jgi:hypothetical protein